MLCTKGQVDCLSFLLGVSLARGLVQRVVFLNKMEKVNNNTRIYGGWT